MSDFIEEYVVLQGTNQYSETKQVLVSKESWEGEGLKAPAYFVGCPDAKKVGEVTLDGKLEGHTTLNEIFNSD